MRALSAYLRNLPQAHRYLCWFAKVVVLFRRPFRFLLKLDCEGAEYDILFSAAPLELSRVREIRMEYHSGPDAELRTYLESAGFEITFFRPDSASTGSIWARREGMSDRS